MCISRPAESFHPTVRPQQDGDDKETLHPTEVVRGGSHDVDTGKRYVANNILFESVL